MIVQSDDPIYRAMVAAFTADKRNRVIPAYGIRRKVIDLSVAAVEQEFKLYGDFVYCDFNSTGVALCSLNNTSEDAFPLLALAGVQNIPYEGLYLSWAAQVGLVLNLWYGYNSQFISPTSAIATIGGITNPVRNADFNGNSLDSVGPFTALTSAMRYLLTQDGGISYGAAFASSTLNAANTAQNIIAAGANVAGYVLQDATYLSNAATQQLAAFLAKVTAPASFTDGDTLLGSLCAVAGTSGMNSMRRQVRVAIGKRLDFLAGVAEVTGSARSALYTVLS